MPHAPFPYYKASRGTWYVEVDRKQHALGRHPDGLPPPAKKDGKWEPPPAILKAFYRIMADHAEDAGRLERPADADAELVVYVFDEFLDWCQRHKAPLTYVWYRDRIEGFARTIDKRLSVSEFRPIQVERWVDAHPEWSASHQRGCKVAVQRAFSWAEKMGVIDRNPIRHLEKPEAGKRERVITHEEHAELLAHYRDEAFRSLLEMAWHTGARPQETIRIEARHCQLDARRIVLPPKEAKGKKRYRIIYLDDAALELVRRKVQQHPDGPIFRNIDGNPWTAWAVNNRFCRLQASRGREQGTIQLDDAKVEAFARTLKPTLIEHGVERPKTELEKLCEARKKLRARAAAKQGGKLFLYAYRHSFANRLLTAGVDSLTVSTLLGHVDGTMLTRVYQHLQQNADHLIAALNRVTGSGDAA
jgi:integrase/recombinase XerD